MSQFSPASFLNLEKTAHGELFAEDEPVWAALSKIGSYVAARIDSAGAIRINGKVDDRAVIGPDVYVGHGAVVEAFATIKGPAWIGDGTTVRSGAYVRENVITGKNCMLGNSCEFKNCVLFDNCEVPHFNYVGDSILGHKAHLGAGVICSNVRLDRKNVKVEGEDTGLRKFGAIVGDRTEVGCNSVLSPGSLLGRDCVIFPCTHWRGALADSKIVKNSQGLEIVDR
ncbi:MAG: UDP-N-acetylglucosamine diphosphorylase [Verrucomicrobiales bacterium]|nr:UDP-N-acetylglucosamine diphosphorylase [Verrucomicrobiales bacterium]